MKRTLALSLAAALMAPALASAQVTAAQTFPALGAPDDPSVPIAWNKFYDVDGINELLQELHDAYPDHCELVVVGESAMGRKIMALEITNEATGPALSKPAMYIDGNIHGNEAQCSETVVYTAWYLLEMKDRVDRIADLLDHRAFYLLPTINPDGRDNWLHGPNNPNMSRGGVIPVDNDGDGQFDEDPPDDLDGDGHITRMRIKDPFGSWRVDPKYPDFLMVRVEDDERGEYRLLSEEGIDNDGDGDINEDGLGGYDPNRNWPYHWQPEGVQYGAGQYPFSLPETRAVSEYVLARPNIAAVQSYHNTGGMILRGPGHGDGNLKPADDALHAFIAERGEAMLPGYRSLVTWKDLYQVYGGEFDWFYGGLGIVSFTNELFTQRNYYHEDMDDPQQDRAAFMRYLLQNEGLTPWTEFEHPQLGTVEIGGTHKTFGRVPPSFMIEEELHRNMAFTLYHAECMPRLAVGDVQVTALGGGASRVRVAVENHGLIPTRIAQDIDNQITPRDVATLSGPGLRVLKGGIVEDADLDKVVWQKIRPERLLVEAVPGNNRLWVEFLVEGTGQATFRFEAGKGGIVEATVTVE